MKRHVLHVLRQHERPGLEHQNAATTGRVRDKEMLRDHAAKRATSDDDGIEVARPSTDGLSNTVERLRQGVAQKAPHIIQRETSWIQKPAMVP